VRFCDMKAVYYTEADRAGLKKKRETATKLSELMQRSA
ncbi:MAG: hypothetical protein H6Q48_5220, partial [Deltaproteobacteria bacterium]|nr:hypothetical protein [Deltaproteobacteria bacterium]